MSEDGEIRRSVGEVRPAGAGARTVWAVLASAVLASACGSSTPSADGGADASLRPDAAERDASDSRDADEDGGAEERVLRGRIVSPRGAFEDVVAGARVRVGEAETFSDELGLFELPRRGDVVVVEPPVGYAPTTWRLGAAQDDVIVPLLETCEAAFDASAGGEVRIERCGTSGGGVALTFPERALEDDAGVVATGSARIVVAVADPTDDAQLDALPHEDDDDVRASGGLEVRLFAPDGRRLQVRAGVSVAVRLVVGPEGEEPRVEVFDEGDARWVDEGAATVADGVATFEATHFSHRRVRMRYETCGTLAELCFDPRIAGGVQREGVTLRALPTESPESGCISSFRTLDATGCIRVRAEHAYRFRASYFRPLSRELFTRTFAVTAPEAGASARVSVELPAVRLGCLQGEGRCVDPGAVERVLEVRDADVGRVAMVPSAACGVPYCVPVPVGVPLRTCLVRGSCFAPFTVPETGAGSVCGGSGTCFSAPTSTPSTLQLRVAGAGAVELVGGALRCVSEDFDRANPTSCAEPFRGTITLRAIPNTSHGFTATHWAGACATESADTCTVDDAEALREVVACFHDGSAAPTGRPWCLELYGE